MAGTGTSRGAAGTVWLALCAGLGIVRAARRRSTASRS
jgi:hypothetical protein